MKKHSIKIREGAHSRGIYASFLPCKHFSSTIFFSSLPSLSIGVTLTIDPSRILCIWPSLSFVRYFCNSSYQSFMIRSSQIQILIKTYHLIRISLMIRSNHLFHTQCTMHLPFNHFHPYLNPAPSYLHKLQSWSKAIPE